MTSGESNFPPILTVTCKWKDKVQIQLTIVMAGPPPQVQVHKRAIITPLLISL